jgi:hypothetical protein
MTVRRPLIILLAALALPSTAAAQDGVFVDPNSPSGKEYQIPLESARRQADPKRKSGKVVPGERGGAPLFGEGIQSDDATPAAAAGGSGGGSGSGGGGSGGSGGGGTGSGGSGGSAGDPAPAAKAPPAVQEAVEAARSRPAPSGGGLGTAIVIGGGVAVLLLAGAGAGLAARRSGRPDPVR